jgi:argininosuccinate lyase
MPQKKNPDILELTRGKSAHVIGNLVAILTNLKGLMSGYGRDLQEIKPMAFSSSKIAISALVVLGSMFATLKVNRQKMRQAADSGYLAALDIAEFLVKDGTPFREAHKIVGSLVQIAHNSKKPLKKLTAQEISSAAKQVNPSKILKIISSINTDDSLKNRTSRGSAGFSEQKRMITARNTKIRQYRYVLARQTAQVSEAAQTLSKKIYIITK